MTIVSYASNSPYAATPQLSWRIDRFVYRPIPEDGDDQIYTLLARHQYRPDRLAYELYRSPAYWWVFCGRNPFLRSDPVWDFVAGLQIMVPSFSYLSKILGA